MLIVPNLRYCGEEEIRRQLWQFLLSLASQVMTLSHTLFQSYVAINSPRAKHALLQGTR